MGTWNAATRPAWPITEVNRGYVYLVPFVNGTNRGIPVFVMTIICCVLDNMGHLAFTRWTNCSTNHLSLFWEAAFIFWKLFFSFDEVDEKLFHSFPSVRSQCQHSTAAWPTLPIYCWLALQYPYYIPSIYLYYELGLVCSVIIAHLLKDPGH